MKMKAFTYLLFVLVLTVACERPEPEGKGLMLAHQLIEPIVGSSMDGPVAFEDLFVSIGHPSKRYYGLNPPDNWAFLMILFCNDIEGADALIDDSG